MVRQYEHCTLAKLNSMANLVPGEVLFNSVVKSIITVDNGHESISQMQWKTTLCETHPPYSLIIEVIAAPIPSINIC